MNINELLGTIGKTDESDKISYSAGVIMAQSLKDIGFDEIKYDDYLEGMKSVFNDSYPKITQKQAIAIFQNYVALLQEDLKERNAELGKEFLNKNAQKEGVITLESGLQFEILVQGNGEIPTINDVVRVIYEGTLLSGDVFDSTKESGAIDMNVAQTILAWQEALLLMPVGSRWKLYIPHHLAYGEYGAQPMIQPNSTLIFIIELLEIV
ncbi:FKBP-type peptidyl-prolyl cis-trans isomerase [Flavobacterium sp.]|uniref:FKBP-type peptidyl-prolyl cis-trans isomerase n=1 Tax=Flavobacterium sp. TaxID=239 RepID=UPI0025BC9D03|nr:FKBP-type peptidyl-prolyl cis-trans isomerase [Flavobacterium sp.]MBA4275835.1 peptidylprolyl isomerase [Flavobacterium sp.]